MALAEEEVPVSGLEDDDDPVDLSFAGPEPVVPAASSAIITSGR